MNKDWIERERIKVVADAESYLVDFCETFSRLPWKYRPPATKNAICHLVVLALADPVRAEIFMRDVARAADVSRAKLRQLVESRCWFFENLNRLTDNRRTRKMAECNLVEMIAL